MTHLTEKPRSKLGEVLAAGTGGAETPSRRTAAPLWLLAFGALAGLAVLVLLLAEPAHDAGGESALEALAQEASEGTPATLSGPAPPVLNADADFAEASLAGMEGALVVIEYPTPIQASEGLTRERTGLIVEDRLAAAGFMPFTLSRGVEWAALPGKPFLHVMFDEEPMQGVNGYAMGAKIALYQQVTLTGTGLTTWAVTWQESVLGSTPNGQIVGFADGAAAMLADMFVEAWRSANPQEAR